MAEIVRAEIDGDTGELSVFAEKTTNGMSDGNFGRRADNFGVLKNMNTDVLRKQKKQLKLLRRQSLLRRKLVAMIGFKSSTCFFEFLQIRKL
jgi:hypothetical protein